MHVKLSGRARRCGATLLFVGLLGSGTASCSGANSCSTSAPISGQVLNNTTGGIVANAVIVLQKTSGGPDISTPTQATQQYTVASAVDGNGSFSLSAPCGPYNVYAFAPGFVSAAASTFAGRAVALGISQNDSNTVLPKISKFAPAGDPLTAGASTSFSATLSAGAADPLSNQVLLINSVLGRITAFQPPAEGSGKAYPNGLWTAPLTAPTAPGVYRYGIVVVSVQGATAVEYLTVNVQR